MKLRDLFLILLVFWAFNSQAQKKFTLKTPDVKTLKKELLDSNYSLNTVLRYFEKNYPSASEKFDIKLDPDFNNAECGFTKKFSPGITYIFYSCGEAQPQKERIILPKVNQMDLKLWIELLYKANATNIKNTWYNKNEYGPTDKEAGCYYTIKQADTESIVSIWCGS